MRLVGRVVAAVVVMIGAVTGGREPSWAPRRWGIAPPERAANLPRAGSRRAHRTGAQIGAYGLPAAAETGSEGRQGERDDAGAGRPWTPLWAIPPDMCRAAAEVVVVVAA